MRKLIYALIPVLLALCSCGGDKNGGNEPLRDIVVTRTLMNHVVNSASGAVDGVNTSDYNIVIDRNNLTADLSTSLTINGAKTAVALHDIKVDYDQDVQWVTFKPSSTLGGSDELTVSGYYDIFNDVIKLELIFGDDYKVNATKPTIYYTSTLTTTDTIGNTYKFADALYTFAIDPAKMTADVTISDITLSKTTGRITQLRYQGLDVTATSTGFLVQGKDIEVVPIKGVSTESVWDYSGLSWMDRFVNNNAVAKYQLKELNSSLYLPTGEMSAEWSTPVYSSIATGKYYKDQD